MFKNKPVAISSLVVTLITFLFFLPSLGGEFIIQDDSLYIVGNPLIRQFDPDMVAQAFARAHCGWWMPLTWISFAFDYHLWGLNPFGYHLHNMVLHALNAGLVVLIADRLCRQRPIAQAVSHLSAGSYPLFLLFTGLLFGLHPLRVESVAWVAERKDVLNGILAFGAVFLYLGYARAREEQAAGGWWQYGGALLLFALSLMAKGSSVGLAVMLLVLDWYPLERLRRETVWTVVLEKIPFLAAGAASAFATVYFVRENSALVSLEAFPFSQRLVVSGNSLWEYWRLFIFPLGLTPLHVIPDPIPAAYVVKAVAVALLLGWIFCTTRLKWLKATLLCFILPLFPVLGFFQNGDQAYAARFTYLAALAQTFVTAVIIFRLLGKGVLQRRLATVAAVVLLAGSVAFALPLFADWRNTESYWTSIIAREPLAINYKERGRHYFTAGRYNLAIADFSAALERMTRSLEPYAYNLYGYRGEAYRMAGEPEKAVADFTRAIAGLPQPAYYHHRGLALRTLGRTAEAAEDFRRAGPDPGPISWYD